MNNGELTKEEREAKLKAQINNYVRQGWQLESAIGGQAILTKEKKIPLVWNLVLSLLTLGIWLLVIGYRKLRKSYHTKVITVSSSGFTRVT